MTIILMELAGDPVSNFCEIFQQFSDSIRETMKKKYIENPEFNYEKVNRASTACGPMVKWAIAQVSWFSFNLLYFTCIDFVFMV